MKILVQRQQYQSSTTFICKEFVKIYYSKLIESYTELLVDSDDNSATAFLRTPIFDYIYQVYTNSILFRLRCKPYLDRAVINILEAIFLVVESILYTYYIDTAIKVQIYKIFRQQKTRDSIQLLIIYRIYRFTKTE